MISEWQFVNYLVSTVWQCVACHKQHSQEFSYFCAECDRKRESGDLDPKVSDY